MIEVLAPGSWAALAGLACGLVLGLAARFGRFCTLGAIEDALFGHDWTRARLWASAIAVAIASTHLAALVGWVDLAASPYVERPLNVLATLAGGATFGIGMALVGTCGYGCLARLGGGDLRAFLVFLVMGIAAYAALAGPLARPIARYVEPLGLAGAWSLPPLLDLGTLGAAGVALAVSAAMLAWCLADSAFRRSSRPWWGAASGLAVTFGWVATTWLAEATFEAVTPRSLTFVRPLGDTTIWVMTTTATPLSFGIGAVTGVVAGAFVGALKHRELRWEAFDDAREMRRQILGAVLMGVGGVLAFGCTIGQGVTAFSTLALSAPLTLAAMVAGAWLGLTVLIGGRAGMRIPRFAGGRR